MKRQPSIHITLEELENHLKDNGIKNASRIAKDIAKKSKKVTLSHRSILTVKSAVKKKISKGVDSNEHYAEKFNGLLSSIRLQKRLQGGSRKSSSGIKPIKRDSKQYTTLLKVVEQAMDFCDTYELEYLRGGFKSYINIGLSFMRTYRLNSFITLEERIVNYKEIELELLEDDNRLKTEQFYYNWIERLEKDTGIVVPFKEDKEKYIHIMRGKQAADKYNANYEDWIEAQFAGLAFINNIPELNQIHTKNAEVRYQKYLYVLKLNNDGKTKLAKAFDNSEEENWYYQKYLKNNDTKD